MDPVAAGDPVVLLEELISLLRAIKDLGNAGQTAAALGAVRHIAALSNANRDAGAHSALPIGLISPASSHCNFPAAGQLTKDILPQMAQSPVSEAPVPHVASRSIATTHSNPEAAVSVDALAPFIGGPVLETTHMPSSDAPVAADAASLSLQSRTAAPKPLSPVPCSNSKASLPPLQDTRDPVPAQLKVTSKAPGSVQQGIRTQPGPALRKPRNLIVCIDGTSNQFSRKNTNVVELYHRLVKDDNQLTFYNSGIGTYATPSWKSLKYLMQVLKNKIDLAIAWNFEKILLSAYLWLSENYREGDKIYLFGFSRGAYQVRALSAMIESVGLLYKGNQDQIPFAYQLYAETKPIPSVDLMRERFKETFSWTVTVELVGVWDTVSSVGLVRDKTLPGTTDGMKHVRYFRHALALHERRVKFLHENAREGLGPLKEDTEGDRPHTKEVWFSGSHSNIGGGAMPNEDLDSFGPALRWMTFEATLAGVRLKDGPEYWRNVAISNSLTPVWQIFEVLPFARLTYRDANKLTYRPHLGRPRKIQEHQLIHETALNRIHNETPVQLRWRARLPDSLRWDKNALLAIGLVEADPYTAANRYFDMIAKPEFSGLTNIDIVGLQALVSTEIGLSSLRDLPKARDLIGQAIHRMLVQEGTVESERVYATLDVLLTVMGRCNFDFTTPPVPEVRTHATRIALADDVLARRLLQHCDSAMIGTPLEHPDVVNSVAYMPDGKHVVSGCTDGAIRIWDLVTGRVVGVPLTGHTSGVWGVAVSVDGTQIASGSEEKTIRIWSVDTGRTISVLEGHDDWVNALTFTLDGSRVVSASDDRTIRVWDVASAKTVVGPILGHSDWIHSLATSPDGSRIVSGANDDTVCVWNAWTGGNIWRIVVSSHVAAVAYSPDGRRIVAGCRDGSVRILDGNTGEVTLSLRTSYSTAVHSVAFSPDGSKIALGLSDGVYLWDPETGAELDVLKGHRGLVSSVVFSPDCKSIASSSIDRTVRIWNATGERMRL